MINKYNKGVIFKFDEKEKQFYMIISNIKKDDEQYLLVTPIDDIKNIIVDYNRAFLVKVDAEEKLTIEDDKELIKYVIKETIKEEQIREKNMNN